MAIFHLTTYPISRGAGHSAVAAAAYRAGEELADVRTGQVSDYTRKSGVLSAEIVTPQGVPTPGREELWNAAEAAENRKDSRVAREWRVALPAELNDEQRRELARALGQQIAERYGVAVDVCVHAPDKSGDDRNHHAHLLSTTRQIDANGNLGAKAAIELGNKDRQKAGIPGTTQQEIVELRAAWAEMTNAALERAGEMARVDHRSYADQGVDLTPTKHVGPNAVGMDRRGLASERVELHNETREENAAKIEADPTIIFEKITQTQAVFDRRDMARELHRYVDDADKFQAIMLKLETSRHLVQLAPEEKDGKHVTPARYSTRDMIEVEASMIGNAEKLGSSDSHRVSDANVAAAIGKRETLSKEQREAVKHVTGSGQLAVIVGDAGTGKSFAMATAKDAWEAQGFRVRGCALSGKAADELQAGSGIESRTIHSLEHGWKRGKDQLTSRDVLVLDEAGMVGSRQLGRVLEAAEKAGAKVVLLGDDKQLAAIEAGAGFRAVTERVGATEITEIRRQKEEWARAASREFARGDVRAALDAYKDHGAVEMAATREDAKATLAANWLADRDKGGSSIILAHSNKDVQSLNETIRAARKEAGELANASTFETERGRRDFAAGDRIVFLKNDTGLGVKNGSLGTVETTDTGKLAVALDDGRKVAFQQAAYANVDHGYAVTIHKSQGVTVDRAHVLATPGMDRSLAYVGMTRHREAATLYAGRDDFGTYDKLAWGIARERPKESTLDFADRRGFNGEQVVRQWVERGRETLEALGQRAKAALDNALERAGEPQQAATAPTPAPAKEMQLVEVYRQVRDASPEIRERAAAQHPEVANALAKKAAIAGSDKFTALPADTQAAVMAKVRLMAEADLAAGKFKLEAEKVQTPVEVYRQVRDASPQDWKQAAEQYPELANVLAMERAARDFAAKHFPEAGQTKFMEAHRAKIEKELQAGRVPDIRRRETEHDRSSDRDNDHSR